MGAGALMVLPTFAMKAPGDSGIKISLAEWSFHRAIKAKKLNHLDFAMIAKRDYGINAVEYVNGFFGGSKMNFKKAATDKTYLNEMLKRSQDAGVYNHLLMCDDEGDLSVPNEKTLMQSVENHKKWIEAAKILGCATVRVNLHGKGTPEDRKAAAVNALGKLGEFAAPMQINVVVENHGSVTSDAEWLCDVMKQVGKDNVGTLPDFGNFCISDPWGTIQDGCKDMYDIYKGVELMLQYAKGVSAKTYDFDEKGEQPKLDYQKLLGIVKNSGFKGYIGVEFEGNSQSEDTGVRKTQQLLARYL
jgi:sugar phosphate isomerase/epimerase